VTITINPPVGTLVYGVQDKPPSGWTVSGVSDNGEWDAANGAVKWYFLDSRSRQLSYTVTPPGGGAESVFFDGQVNVNGGQSEAIDGNASSQQCDG